MKLCKKCDAKLLNEKRSICDECKDKHRKEYLLKNKDKIKEYQRNYQKDYQKEYNEKNIENIRKRNRIYMRENKERFKEYQKEYQKGYIKNWIEKNKDKIKEYNKSWKEKNKDKIEEYRNRQKLKMVPFQEYWDIKDCIYDIDKIREKLIKFKKELKIGCVDNINIAKNIIKKLKKIKEK